MESGDPRTERIRLDLAYDGTGFSGWAKQPGLRTVQGELEDALATVFRRTGEPPRLVVAGRTDVGVHALGQVAHLDVTPRQAASVRGPLARRLNGILGAGSGIHVHGSGTAPDGFDARFAALWRRYEYRIADDEAAHDPRRSSHTVWHPGALDAAAMHEAAQSLLGLHDFASFCKPREGATTIRTLQAFDWSRDDEGVLIARLRADAFCHSMVRALVGACVGAPERVAELRDARERTSAFRVMPAKGLTLMEVGYPPDAELAARAEQTRGKRGLPQDPPID
ncbi:MAG: tRNA pseudouridine(38-40) synthase TruA [Microbacteriaceae bacterium]|nr:tRNA pseudouridine(38-40) synthase TruA [Microbacteriaceae bacterium]